MVVVLAVLAIGAKALPAEEAKTGDKGMLVLVEFRKWVGKDAKAHALLAQEVRDSLKTAGLETAGSRIAHPRGAFRATRKRQHWHNKKGIDHET